MAMVTAMLTTSRTRLPRVSLPASESLTGTRLYANPNERGLEKALKAKREFLDSLNARSNNKR